MQLKNLGDCWEAFSRSWFEKEDDLFASYDSRLIVHESYYLFEKKWERIIPLIPKGSHQSGTGCSSCTVAPWSLLSESCQYFLLPNHRGVHLIFTQCVEKQQHWEKGRRKIGKTKESKTDYPKLRTGFRWQNEIQWTTHKDILLSYHCASLQVSQPSILPR